ncbi:50S ribosomal protein L11 methyltransferase [Marixanthomonas spongiae]|uniref:Ribosomal protein L11 methyltransferase n=1 Tax=Marixanthomonas spongiae TaxID=2174845 RepID=A0A2U0I5R1_9FLAO|nr:50S ribosomal protein L11 methyltransferase [Marixanthomonas spongiae]PVW16404.1 50S ribosomal protein L11 methyltransferase [Marixanthomonas spongiae]
MLNSYLEFAFTVTPVQPGTDILIAQLGEAGFESFVETETGVLAYIQKGEWQEPILDAVGILSSDLFAIDYTKKEIAQTNWNAEWENNFTPIAVGDTCVVRAPFHKAHGVPYEIVIEPKMSFGTGHHETTFMMLQFILENDWDGKTVLDMGCGTAVLAILAEKRGAAQLDAIDIDTWCVENSQENVERNGCSHISVALGDAGNLPAQPTYDTIIANINRNILLDDMATYHRCLKPKGELYLSGFYKEDLPLIQDCCTKLGLTFVENKERHRWIAAKFVN